MDKQNENDSPYVVCDCGEKILLVPELDKLVKNIKAHASLHRQKELDPIKADKEYRRIEKKLTLEVLFIISENAPTQNMTVKM